MTSQETQPSSPTTIEKSQVETEIIYVLRNPAMPNYVKIGKTQDLQQRMKDLDNTSIPVPFECIYAALVEKTLGTRCYMTCSWSIELTNEGSSLLVRWW